MGEFIEIMKDYSKVSDENDMWNLSRVLDKMFCDIKEMHPEMYDKYITKVKLSNKHIPWDKQQAECAVMKMRNKDGTEGEHWTYDQTTEVMDKKNYDFNPAEWYYVLNMIYSDHYSQDFNTDIYVRLAHDKMTDIDAPKNASKRMYTVKHYQ